MPHYHVHLKSNDLCWSYAFTALGSGANRHHSNFNKKYDELVGIECTPQQQHCAKYGLSPVLCIGKTDPPDKINLEVVQEFCWFATKEVTDMDNSNKQNVLYWWYMTNLQYPW